MPLKSWSEVPEAIANWLEPTRKVALALGKYASALPYACPIDFYYNPETEKLAIAVDDTIEMEAAGVALKCASEVGQLHHSPVLGEEDKDDPWIKVAYSPTLRTLSDMLNFTHGTYPGGIPNAPSPLAAMLTSGVVGAGLGYGAGHVAKYLLPEEYGRKLPYTGAMLGGLGGASLAAPWMADNVSQGKSILEPPPVSGRPHTEGNLSEEAWIAPTGTHLKPNPVLESLEHSIPNKPVVPPGYKMPKASVQEKQASGFGADFLPPVRPPGPYDVNINALGQTMYSTGVDPQVAAATLGTMYAASQLPASSYVPGHASAEQLGNMAMRMTGDYVGGVVAGKLINTVIGTPHSPSTFGVANVLLRSVLPTFLGS